MGEEKTPVPVKGPANVPEKRSSSGEIDVFVRQAKAVAATRAAGGRLILALDATMSRQPTWDLACTLQAQMFDAVGQTGGKAGPLGVQLVYFRGLGECRASKFVNDTAALKRLMTDIACQGGSTQIGKVLAHALRQTATQKVDALVYIGDAMEETLQDLAVKAGNLGLRGVPVFVFQEGRDGTAENAFREIARLSKGAWFRFDRNSAATLAKLLTAVELFATGGVKALEARDRPEDRLMIEGMRGGGSA
ncbi:MAG: VWA domain-containing protein [Hyphomicrobiales bacterium]|nr:VWA domain-containing protein [Hyphomicrobiales bacterium]